MSKKVTVSADGTTATVATPTIGDIFTTLVSTDSALTGSYGLAQRAVLVGAGMAIQNYRLTGNLNPL